MAKQLQISIPTPCHEDWDKMTDVVKGKFCDSCQKQVIDFSVMSDRQLAEFFKKPSNGSVCGRFMADQLERDIAIPRKRIPWIKYFFQVMLPAFLLSIKTNAQKTQGTPAVIVADDDDRGVKGFVNDGNTGKALPQAVVEMVSTIGKENIKVRNDGSFYLNIYRKITVKTVTISCPGYETKQMTLQQFMNASHGQRIISLEKEILLGNIVAIDNVVTMDEVVVLAKIPEAKLQQKDHCSSGLENVLQGKVAGPVVTVVEKKPDGINRDLSKPSVILPTQELSGYVGAVSVGISNKKPTKKEPRNVPFFPDQPNAVSSFNVYPNPVMAGSTATIEAKKMTAGTYTLSLFNQLGQLVYTREIILETKTKRWSIDIPVVLPGSYLLNIIHKDSHKKFTQKIIIQ